MSASSSRSSSPKPNKSSENLNNDLKNKEKSASAHSINSNEDTTSKSSSSSNLDSAKHRHKFRTGLPSPMVDRSKVSIWSILKQCVDKELYRFTIPIVWNEPTSLLQRMAENMKYSNLLLDKACELKNPIDRMKYVAGFLVSSTSVHHNRLSKPFNPLLGETYEYVCTENNFRICCEQVSHHPPISAYYSESIKPSSESKSKWKYYGSVNPHMKLNFLNASVEAYPEGVQTVEFPELDEVYTWHNLKINAHNLILGKLWFEYTGRTEIINHKHKIKCVLDFKPYSWFSGHLNRCDGYIVDAHDNKLALLNGKWDECFYATNNVANSGEFLRTTEKFITDKESRSDKSHKKKQKSGTTSNTNDDIQLIWKFNDDEHEKCYQDYYFFTQFTFKLNEMYDALTNPTIININENAMTKSVSLGPLPPTDSRYRPDMRLYENGDIETASSEKNRLEEKQRETEKKMEKGEIEKWKALWFEKKSHAICEDEETWSFNNKYWNREYSKCPDIY